MGNMFFQLSASAIEERTLQDAHLIPNFVWDGRVQIKNDIDEFDDSFRYACLSEIFKHGIYL